MICGHIIRLYYALANGPRTVHLLTYRRRRRGLMMEEKRVSEPREGLSNPSSTLPQSKEQSRERQRGELNLLANVFLHVHYLLSACSCPLLNGRGQS